MNDSLRQELLAMEAHDEAVRGRLAEDGSLFGGYHPGMEAVHRANATRLRAIIDAHGWPGASLAGEDGALAAWRIAQHSIGEPTFMRWCRDLLDGASARGEVPRWQFAMIDDRIRVFEGRPQRYGTQLRGGPGGLEPCALEDASKVEGWRKEAGLPALAPILAQARAHPPPQPADQALYDAAELCWRREVGWLTPSDEQHKQAG